MSSATTSDSRFQQNPLVQASHIDDLVTVAAQQGLTNPNASNLANTTGGADYTYSWQVATVNHIMLQNNTGAALQFEIDKATSNGSPILATGQTIFLDIKTATLHLLTAANENVDGTVAGNIVVRAWQ